MTNATKRVVEMADGRKLTFGKIEKVKKEILTDTNGRPTGIRFDGDSGDSFVAAFDKLPDAEWITLAEPTAISVWAMAHGYNQKIGDSYAGADNTADCMESARMIWDRLCKGDWKSDAKGFGASAVLLEAVCRAFPDQDRADVRTKLAGMTKAQRDAVQMTNTIKPHYDAVMRERTKGDATELLAKFQ